MLCIIKSSCTYSANDIDGVLASSTERGCCRSRDRMVVGFITTYVISAYHHWLWVRISIRVRCTTLCDKVCPWLAKGQWFSPGHPISSTNKTDCNNITEILLKVALNTIKLNQTNLVWKSKVKPKIIKLVFAVSLLSVQEKRPVQSNQDNVSKLSNMSTHGLSFQETSTIKIQLTKHVGLV
jgi:hypothetical protein